jgi:ribosomal protein S12 methylthiotransferase
LLRVIRENDNVCNYLDIALQHISDGVLSRMQRHTTRQETLELIDTLRREVPGICLRTTLMVGFPGETEEEFKELMDFVRTVRFERMGAFAYSEEEGTYAAEHYTDDIPDDVKETRLSKVMRLQERIIAEQAAEKVGRTFKTIIDRREGDYYIGRTEYDSPEVDCEVLVPVSGGPLEIGHFYQVKVDAADDFDLYGTVI